MRQAFAIRSASAQAAEKTKERVTGRCRDNRKQRPLNNVDRVLHHDTAAIIENRAGPAPLVPLDFVDSIGVDQYVAQIQGLKIAPLQRSSIDRGQHRSLGFVDADAGIVGEVQIGRRFESTQLKLRSACVFPDHLEPCMVGNGVVDLWTPVEGQHRARSGLDPNLVRRDSDHLAVADRQRSAT